MVATPMATVAIGDIHGNLAALQDLLPRVMAKVSHQDTLVLLGDYIDRGSNSRGCLERIIRLKDEAPCPVVTLIGNHEDWMLKTLRDFTDHSWVLDMEGFDTISSYSADAAATLRRELDWVGRHVVEERVRIGYEIFFDSMPRKHLEFLKRLKLYHRTADVVCVHGGVLGDRPLDQQDPETLLWGPDGFPDGYHGLEAVVYGHWNNSVPDENGWPGPCVKANRTFGIDTISHGFLTAMSFPDGEVIQSGWGGWE